MAYSYSYLDNVSKIVCIGRNYVDHIKELNNLPPSEPFFFLKPPSSLLTMESGDPILLPKNTTVHHETELVLIMNRELKHLSPETFSDQDVLESIEGYALGFDLTARSLQSLMKSKGLPWTSAKGFDTFLPISPFIPKDKIPNPYNCELICKVNEETKQDDLTNLMIFNLKEILISISQIMTIKKGDLIMTGTPKGVGLLKDGDALKGYIKYGNEIIKESIIEFNCKISPSPYIGK